MWIGKIIGALSGYLLGGPLGALIGFWIGHFFDRNLKIHHDSYSNWNQVQARSVFFEATFSVMGHLAKADGRISEREIKIAETVMKRMKLSKSQRQEAIRLFNEGKASNFHLDGMLERLKKAARHNMALLQLFVDIQQQAAFADGMNSKKQQMFQIICQRLSVSPFSFAGFEHIFGQAHQRTHSHQQQSYTRPRQTHADPYSILGINKQASDQEIKQRYRKLMSENHPDKLVAQGLPEEMIKIATEKTQKIQTAYDQIKKARGLR